MSVARKPGTNSQARWIALRPRPACKLWSLLCALLALTAAPSFADDQPAAAAPVPATETPAPSGLEAAKAEAMRLMREGKFQDALEPASTALALSQERFGPNSQEAATAAHNLGFLLRRSGRQAEAQAQLEHALAYYEAHLPAVHEDLRNATGELGQIYMAAGRAADVVKLYEALIARAAAEGDAGHIGTAHNRNNLAFVLRSQGREDEARAHWEAALAIYQAAAPASNAAHLTAVGALLDAYASPALYEKAQRLVEETAKRLDSEAGRPAPQSAGLLTRLADLANAAGKFTESRSYALRAVAIYEASAAASPRDLPGALNSLARAERALANHAAAETAYKRAIELTEAAGSNANAGIISDNLAVLYAETGRTDLAETYHKRALALIEAALGPDHPASGEVAGNLAAFLLVSGRYEEAEPFFRRAIASADKEDTPSPVKVAILLDNLSMVLRNTGRPAEAIESQRRALALLEAALPADHPTLGMTHGNLGQALIATGALAEAESHLLKALAIAETAYGPDHPTPAMVHSNLGELYLTMGRTREAREQWTRAVDGIGRHLGQTHQNLLPPLLQLAELALKENDLAAAEAAFRQAAGIDAARAGRSRPTDASEAAAAGAHRIYAGLLETLWAKSGRDRAPPLSEAVEIAQRDSFSSAGVAVSALGSRFSTGDARLAALVREGQDLEAEWIAADGRLSKLLSEIGGRDAARETELRNKLDEIEARRAAIDREVRAENPRFGELSRPAPASASEIAALLAPDEAALQFVVTANATHVLAITRDTALWRRVPVREDELKSLTHALRCGLDRSLWKADAAARCLKLLSLPEDRRPRAGEPLPFDLARAHGLYKILIEPVAASVRGKSLYVVASGPLATLPFGVLLTAAPPEAGTGKAAALEAMQRAPWLARSHAITVLPALGSLKVLRQNVTPSVAAEAFVGIGNPLLLGRNGSDRRAFAFRTCADVPSLEAAPGGETTAVASVETLYRGGLADAGALRRQPPLPETAFELCTVARQLGASGASVLLGAEATETRLKAMSASGGLARARVVHFATHGLLAGETRMFARANAEPALLLTPPETPSADDDGLLLASEVAAMRLDADWVVLSACNTAGGEGAGAQSLSGLARAFFYAGTRALLVSHWAVDSEATVALITGAFVQLKQGKAPAGRAEALRRAAVALIDGGGLRSHPAYWAPFVVVGEGGATGASALPPVAPETASLPASGLSSTAERALTPPNGEAKAASPDRPRPSAKPRRKNPPKKKPEPDWLSEFFGSW